MKTSALGGGSPVVGVVACLHGNEPLGRKAIELLKNVPLKRGMLFFLFANEEAAEENKRFIDADLNRCFPGNVNGNHEERLAVEILEKIKYCDYVIDVHATTAKTEAFIIMTKELKKIAGLIPLKKAVKMGKGIASGKALIDYANNGLSLEFPLDFSAERVKECIFEFLKALGMADGVFIKKEQEYYEAYGIKEWKDCCLLENFKETEMDGEVFYPVLYGEKEYKGILCLKAKKEGF